MPLHKNAWGRGRNGDFIGALNTSRSAHASHATGARDSTRLERLAGSEARSLVGSVAAVPDSKR